MPPKFLASCVISQLHCNHGNRKPQKTAEPCKGQLNGEVKKIHIYFKAQEYKVLELKTATQKALREYQRKDTKEREQKIRPTNVSHAVIQTGDRISQDKRNTHKMPPSPQIQLFISTLLSIPSVSKSLSFPYPVLMAEVRSSKICKSVATRKQIKGP